MAKKRLLDEDDLQPISNETIDAIVAGDYQPVTEEGTESVEETSQK